MEQIFRFLTEREEDGSYMVILEYLGIETPLTIIRRVYEADVGERGDDVYINDNIPYYAKILTRGALHILTANQLMVHLDRKHYLEQLTDKELFDTLGAVPAYISRVELIDGIDGLFTGMHAFFVTPSKARVSSINPVPDTKEQLIGIGTITYHHTHTLNYLMTHFSLENGQVVFRNEQVRHVFSDALLHELYHLFKEEDYGSVEYYEQFVRMLINGAPGEPYS